VLDNNKRHLETEKSREAKDVWTRTTSQATTTKLNDDRYRNLRSYVYWQSWSSLAVFLCGYGWLAAKAVKLL
jgi:hypothetical protein